ncbi:hypothetical protein STSP_00070 [Streptomyces jeddahensis]|uniref:Uncharacterized protein n=1 Tax=Streptomyces jeddahensis TaxID=1716141 RepID=A0A177I0L0_9ACTN|nr:hypothetical protein STSP_00070 [Streptomyces jeddahensis]
MPGGHAEAAAGTAGGYALGGRPAAEEYALGGRPASGDHAQHAGVRQPVGPVGGPTPGGHADAAAGTAEEYALGGRPAAEEHALDRAPTPQGTASSLGVPAPYRGVPVGGGSRLARGRCRVP